MSTNDRPISVSEVIEIIEWYERLKGADDETNRRRCAERMV